MKKLTIVFLVLVFAIALFASDMALPREEAINEVPSAKRVQVQSVKNAPTVEFLNDPTDIISTYYDYQPGGYNSWCLRNQPATSSPNGYPAGGMYIAFHTQETSNSTRRVYYAYLDGDGNVITVDPVSTTDVREGYAGIDVDPVTGDPFVAYHAITEDDGSYDDHMAYDLFHLMGSAGLWTTPWIVVDNPEVGFNANGHDGDEYIWPKVMIGPSPEADKRRVYVYGDNSVNNSAGVANYNIIMGYADFSTADLDMQSTLDWTYKTFPVMDQFHYDDLGRTIKDMAIADDGQVALIGWANDSLKVWYSDDYGENFELNSQLCHYDTENPQNQDGTYLIPNEAGGEADLFFEPSPDGGHFNALFTQDNSKIIFFSAMTLNAEENVAEGQYYPFWFMPKIYKYDIATQEFGFWDLNIEGANPGDDMPMRPWDLDEDGEVDSYSEDGFVEVAFQWPSFFYAGDLQTGSFDCSNFELSSNGDWVVAVWQDGTNAYNAYDEIPGYEQWFETPEIFISVSGDGGETWSEPAKMNANPNDENYYAELADMIPSYVNVGDEIKVIDDTHGQVDLFFLDDNSYGPYASSQQGLNNGGTLKYASIKVEFPENTSNEAGEVAPLNVTLKGNYPNPFNPETTIQYSVKETANVKIDVYNTKGQKVKTLVNEQKVAGDHTALWQGKDDSGNDVASGVYFYRLTSQNNTTAKKMLLIK
jgi:hypothetical protein